MQALKSFHFVYEVVKPQNAKPAKGLEIAKIEGDVTADGKMKTCLFSSDEDDIRGLLRSGSEDGRVLEAIRASLDRKPRDHGAGSSPGRTMSQIGG